ncbi:MAG: HAMP domain-containing histidine kinase [Atribacterota bacterium]|nr:HAMP domain-containing histidine kinase [Atribacterota bacterium]
MDIALNLLIRKVLSWFSCRSFEKKEGDSNVQGFHKNLSGEILDILNRLQKPALCFLPMQQTFLANQEFFRITGIPFLSTPRWVHEFPLVGKIVAENKEVFRFGEGEYRVLSCSVEEMMLFVLENSVDAMQWFAELQFFLTALGHELKTPLTILKGYVQILQDEIPPEKRETVSKLQGQVVRLEETLNNFRSLSLLQKKGYISWKEVTEIITLVEQNWQEEIERKKLRWQCASVPDDTSGVISLSRGDFHLLFSNLFSNAVKFSPPKSMVTISWTFEGSCVVLEIGNTLPEDISPREFLGKWEHFRKMKEFPEKNLGIYLIEKALQKMGGRLEVSFRSQGEVIVRAFLPLSEAGFS